MRIQETSQTSTDKNTTSKVGYYQSPVGTIRITGNENGISEVTFLEEELATKIPKELTGFCKQLDEYFEDHRKDFSFNLIPEGSTFQREVWLELLNIPFGKTISYLDLARKMGDEKLTRAVANANGKNPIAIIIPCHRVIGSDGSLTGYAGGLHRKEWLLGFERNAIQGRLFD